MSRDTDTDRVTYTHSKPYTNTTKRIAQRYITISNSSSGMGNGYVHVKIRQGRVQRKVSQEGIMKEVVVRSVGRWGSAGLASGRVAGGDG